MSTESIHFKYLFIMKTKNILFLTALAASLALASCKDDEPFSTITPDDQPCILDPIFPDRTASGDLAIYQSFGRDTNLNLELTVTPSAYTTVSWLIDGKTVHTGLSIDMPFEAGTYTLRVEATTTKGKSTSRECLIEVTPLEGDPWSAESGLERYIAPNLNARLTGENLDKVSGILLGDTPVTEFTYDAENSVLEYSVPSDIASGRYRVSLLDSDGNRYGANTVTVLESATVLEGASTAAPGGTITLSGVKLNDIASITIGEQKIDSFTTQTATELSFTCPAELTSGEVYTISGKTLDGKDVLFGTADGQLHPEMQILMTSEVTLWEGHFAVTNWGEANFEEVRYQLNDVRTGSILRIYYSINSAADYHQIRVVTGDWTRLLGESDADDFHPTEDGLIEMEMTQERITLIKDHAGFICVGHGYFVDKITIE